MTTKMTIYICDSALHAQTAHDFLLNCGYPATGIEVTEQIASVAYDSETYMNDGGTSDHNESVWVVIGRR